MHAQQLRPWIKAARLPSQSYIFLPLLLGQALAMAQGHNPSLGVGILVHAFGLANQLYIVFANDYADRETDKHNQTFTAFSGGSRVLVDGDLTPGQLGAAALWMAGASLATAGLAGLAAGSWLPLLLAALGLGLLWMYSFPPVRMSYRGGGEFLQMLGVGIVLPCLGYAAQAGSLAGFPWHLMVIILPTQLACAISTAIPDYPSDKQDGKRTIPVLRGLAQAKRLVTGLHLLTALQLFAPYARPAQGSGPGVVAMLPLAAALALLFVLGAVPGTKGMFVFTLLSILATLTSTAALTIVHWV